MNIEDQIGKSFELIINRETQRKISFQWEDWLKFDWDTNWIKKEYRKNPKSQKKGNYVVFAKLKEGYKSCRVYDNIHDYFDYIISFEGITIAEKFERYEFIYVWDYEREKLIKVYYKEEGDFMTDDKPFWDRVSRLT